jgi:hypothetical protein
MLLGRVVGQAKLRQEAFDAAEKRDVGEEVVLDERQETVGAQRRPVAVDVDPQVAFGRAALDLR